jgi:NADH:ubiquinone oxidoreductase subunit
MDRGGASAYIGGMNIGTRIFTWLRGRRVGTDAEGNVYYTERNSGRPRPRRWVMYRGGVAEASRVPPEWHAWLHYTTDAPLPVQNRRPWQRPHLANPTGTETSYRPAGHDYKGGRRAAASGDYEAWTPGT